MKVITRAQRKSLHALWLRHMQPQSRNYINVDWDVPRQVGKLSLYQPNGIPGNMPDTPTYREFRKSAVVGDYDSIMVSTYRPGLEGGIWFGIESDGYAHS